MSARPNQTAGGIFARSTGDPTQRILEALRGHGHEPRKAGDGWACRCPGHDDANPSLSISTGNGGNVLLNCHAGCTLEAIVAAVGMKPSDLFTDDPSRRKGQAAKPRRRGDTTPPQTAIGGGSGPNDTKPYPTAKEAVRDLERRHGPHSKAWPYHNDAGVPVGLIVRWDAHDGKIIRPISKGAAGWVHGGMPSPRPMYGLPDLLAAKPGERVYVCEGEKAADAARALGLVATTSAHGSKSAGKSDWSALTGREIIILPDNDEAGERYAADVSRLATAAGAKSVRVVRLVDLWPDIPQGGDMADLLEHRGGEVNLLRADVESLAASTDPEEGDVVDVLAAPPFDPEAMYPSGIAYVKDYIRDLSQSTQTPVEMPALLGLAIASAAVCGVAVIRGHGDHIEPPQVWALVLAEPASRKSAVLSELLTPIVAWERRQAEIHGPAIAAAAQTRKIDEAQLRMVSDAAAKAKDDVVKRDSTAKAVALAQSLQSTPIPTVPIMLASEPTAEALSMQMAANCGRALLASAEGDVVDIMLGRYSAGSNFGVFLKGHAGDPVRAGRVGRVGDVINRPALAVALCVQPQAVRALWADVDAAGRGLLARFAVITPLDQIGSRDVRPPPVPDRSRSPWMAAIDRMLLFPPCDSPMTVSLGAEADEIYHTFQRRTEESLGFGDLSDRQAWGGKLCGLALRIALTLHALSTWALGGKPGDFPKINAGTMRAAIRWADYLAAAERYSRERLADDGEGVAARRLMDWIVRRGGLVTAREVSRGFGLYRGDADAAGKALGELAAASKGCWESDDHGGGRGRPTRRFRLAPPCDSDTNAITPGANVYLSLAQPDEPPQTPAGTDDGWGVI